MHGVAKFVIRCEIFKSQRKCAPTGLAISLWSANCTSSIAVWVSLDQERSEESLGDPIDGSRSLSTASSLRRGKVCNSGKIVLDFSVFLDSQRYLRVVTVCKPTSITNNATHRK